MESPGFAFIGVTALGLGSLMGYAAYKNAPVFGPEGLLTQAITTGKFTAVPATTASTTQNAASATSAVAAGAQAASTVASGGGSEAQAALGGPFTVIQYNAQKIAQYLLGKLKI